MTSSVRSHHSLQLTDRQLQAVVAARRVRRNLVRWRGDTDLGGMCGLASLLLAAALRDVDSLRHHAIDVIKWSPHCWNEIDGVIIDVTATQFNNLSAYEPAVRGVLVTRQPRIYHQRLSGRGAKTLWYLVDACWYDEEDEERRFNGVVDRLRSLSGARLPARLPAPPPPLADRSTVASDPCRQSAAS